ncbi:MAG: XRE family transcriptional regulator [Acidobacteriota bacterium]
MRQTSDRDWRETVLDRISNQLRAKGLKQVDLARRLGVTDSAVSQWMAGRSEPSWWALAELSRMLGVSADWLLGLKPSAEPVALSIESPIGPEGYVALPSMEDQLAAGHALVSTDRYSDTYYAFRQQWLDSKRMKGKKLVMARVARTHHGESMKDTIQPGALLLVDLTTVTPRSFRPRGIYVVRAPGEDGGVTVKRVVLRPGRAICMSDNAAFDPFAIDLSGELSSVLLGRVVWWGNEDP